ncbi:unnamed protein product (macronuclear) [Paramecium tetraurelia]|uniref:Uncharacterized protein n=1 Tax=Paramecium tetraurelia TaxID=5888 RepID=A0BEC7_PARTE|nr:uncharacterized protein GSPATT00027927001 [Paramecium tetraurelia]CAK56894.1 unnamed protein product [Paramecium tetraurelia]|eukprot:XP_001424292.1 hypothetical protein (macronuclear) [Paramecium tetraurelia strain d4-2]
MLSELEIQAVIGFTDKITQGLILHPDNEHIIYPFGSTIVVDLQSAWLKYFQVEIYINFNYINLIFIFFRGHHNQISVLTVSRSGDYVASGQRIYMGFQADIIIWDFKEEA